MMGSCEVYQQTSISKFAVGMVLAIGIFGSYVPQHIKIYRRRTSEGLSPTFLLLGSLSAFAAAVNILLATIPARNCCHSSLSVFQCVNSHVGLIQIFLQTLGYVAIFFMCVFLTKNSLRESKVTHHKLTINYYVFIGYVGINVVILAIILTSRDNHDTVELFADISGIIATVLSIIQYIPQIYTTYTVKHAGSLSVPMMFLQTPGGYIWSLSLYLEPNSKWSSWLPYFSAANLQLILFIMCSYYNFKYPTKLLEANAELRIAEENLASSHALVDETTSLI